MSYRTTAQKLSSKLTQSFGTDVKVTPAAVELALDLMHGSDEATKLVVPYANSIAKAIGLKSSAAVTETSCKRLFRVFAKAHGKFEGDVSKVPDIGRMRILIEKPGDIIALRKLFLGDNPRYKDKRVGIMGDTHPTNHITVTEFEDFYHVPSSTGRIAVHIGLSVKVPGYSKPVPFEIQVIHKDMVLTEDATRRNYEGAQIIERTAVTEGRVDIYGRPQLTGDEAAAVKAYNDSSVEMYRAEALRHDLYDLRRPDLAVRKGHHLRVMELARAA